MWVEGHISDKKIVDVNEELSQLKGDLSEATARKTLGRFLMYNIGILVFWATGIKLYPDQRLLIKGWLFKNFSLTIAGRGFGKTFTLSHFCYLYCLFNPEKTIVMIAPTFRSSRRVIQHIEKWARSKRGFLLKQCIQLTKQGEIVSKQADLWELTFKNGSKIIALPLGVDGERVRGYRCSVLCIDEGLLIPQSTIDKVLKPFIITPSEEETTRRQNVRERESYLIKKGLMKEEDRTKFLSDVKMIIISSASYTWEDLYSLYTKYLKIIYSQDDKMMKKLDEKEREALGKDEEAKAEVIKGDDIPSSYLVQQLSYKAQPPDRIDAAVREEIESGMFSEAVIKREYEAQFVQDSDGYFRARVMEDCTLKGENDPTIEIVGEKGAEYVVAIDPNLGGSETNDHFAMCVIKIIEKKFSDGMRKCGLVVHQYANAGAKPEHHIGYFLYILQNFNVVYVAVDTSQGANMDFINFCNESAQFKTAKRNLQPIQYADFGKENFEDLVREIQNGYNLSAGQIVQKQYFHSTFQKAANEYMQTCFNRRTLLFAAKGIPNESAMTKMRNQSEAVSDILTSHPDFAEEGVSGDIDDFIGQQDVLIDLVKKECALIEVKVSSLGNVTFDLPAHMKKQSKSRSRLRRDSYSALFLGNWALKLYLESKENPTEQFGEFYAGWALPR